LRNTSVRNLYLGFIDPGVENNSNFLLPSMQTSQSNPTAKKKAPQVFVTADRMEVNSVINQPLSIFAHNEAIESKK
jgi:hypothetical protein